MGDLEAAEPTDPPNAVTSTSVGREAGRLSRDGDVEGQVQKRSAIEGAVKQNGVLETSTRQEPESRLEDCTHEAFRYGDVAAVSSNGSSEISVKREPEHMSQDSPAGIDQPAVLAPDSISFVWRRGRYIPAKQSRVKNSLLAGSGFLELANAGDFAANVWNQVPVKTYVAVLMALGGALALSLSYFAFADTRLSWHNVRLLRSEREELKKKFERDSEETEVSRDLNTRLQVNARDLGMELINRVVMNTLMGFGAVMIGIGTPMAIGGANRRVYRASNLLSGYVGNVPLALYALLNAAWSAHIWVKAHQRGKAGHKSFEGTDLNAHLKRRVRKIQEHTVLYGVTGILGGAGSLLASSKWYGYVILIPVIISSIVCNYLWRCKIAYERPCFQQIPYFDQNLLVQRLKSVISACRELDVTSPTLRTHPVSDSEELRSMIEFITANDLFEDFSLRLVCDVSLCATLFGSKREIITINPKDLTTANPSLAPSILKAAQTCVRKDAPTHFQYQERYLLDLLGQYLCTSEFMTEKPQRGASKEPP